MSGSISIAIIAKNEEKNIRRCLESISWANEVIVVIDPDSTDRTHEICEEYDCRIFTRDWDGYTAQKNFAISQATCDWTLSLDADEEITAELAKEIAEVLASCEAGAYTIPRLNMFIGRWMRHGGWYPDRQLRLFKTGLGEFKNVPLHEHIEFKDKTVRIGLLKNPMRHYTYPTIADFITKADRYTGIEAQAITDGGKARRISLGSLFLAMPSKFAEVYLYKGGWRDGIHGLVAAVLMSFRVFIRKAKVWESQYKIKRQ